MSNLEKINAEIEKEFPDDPALQQIHIARKLLMIEAEEKNVSYIDLLREQIKSKAFSEPRMKK